MAGLVDLSDPSQFSYLVSELTFLLPGHCSQCKLKPCLNQLRFSASRERGISWPAVALGYEVGSHSLETHGRKVSDTCV